MHALYHRGRRTAMDIGEDLGFHESTVHGIGKEAMKKNKGRHKIIPMEDIHTLVDILTQDSWHRRLPETQVADIAKIRASEQGLREAVTVGAPRRIFNEYPFDDFSFDCWVRGRLRSKSSDGSIV